MASFKMYLFCVLPIVLGIIFSTEAQLHVPVLLWESSIAEENAFSPGALSQMNVEDFADVLVRRMTRSPVVILFAEKSLSIEDFSRQNSGTGSSFPALQNMKGDARLEFIPAVEAPIKALNRLSKLGYKWEHVSGEVLPGPGKKVLLVELGDLKDGEDRPAMMLRHDKYIASLFKQAAREYPDVLAIYTGRQPSWEMPEPSPARAKREAEPTSAPSTSCNTVLKSAGASDKIMIYTSECPILKINNTQFSLTSGTSEAPTNVKTGNRIMVVRYKLGNSSEKAIIRFKFNSTSDGYWQLIQAEVDDSPNKYVLNAPSVIGAPNDFSYSCGNKVVFENPEGTVKLELKNIKVQPGVQQDVFSDPINCATYFTIPIWSGLFVSFLLLFIVGWGIDMMMNIHTMDRFDDPKGKPLVFNAQE